VKFLTEDDLGFYAVAYKLAFLLMLPINAFQTAWGPFAYAIYKNEDAEDTYNSVLILFTIIICFIGLAIILFAKLAVILLAGEKYLGSTDAVAPLVLSLIFMSITWIVGIGIDLSKKTFWKIFSNSIQLTMASLIIYFLIVPLGILGVSLGIMIGYLVLFIWEYYLSHKLYKIRFHLSIPSLLISISALISLISYYLSPTSLVYNCIFNFMLLTLFTLVVYVIDKKRYIFSSIKAIKI